MATRAAARCEVPIRPIPKPSMNDRYLIPTVQSVDLSDCNPRFAMVCWVPMNAFFGRRPRL